MKLAHAFLLSSALVVSAGAAMAQSYGGAGDPARANTTDPNSAPIAGTTGTSRGTRGLDAAGRANTADPQSANSPGTNAAGRPVDPYDARDTGANGGRVGR